MRRESRSRYAAAATLWPPCVLACVALINGCGGSSGAPSSPSAAPTPAAPVAPTILVASGLTGLPLAGVAVRVPGGTAVTDSSGTATLPATTAVGASLDLEAPGHFTRQTTFRNADTIFLWPRSLSSSAGEAYTARLSYTSTVADATEGAAPLRRVVPGFPVALAYLPAELRTDAFVEAARTAIAWINEATQNAPTYQLVFEKPAPNQVVFQFALDVADSVCEGNRAFFRTTLVSSANNSEIYAGIVNLCDLRYTRDAGVIAHELGHSLGLYHSRRTEDVMYSGGSGRAGFTGEEKLLVFLAKQRRGGNRFPDIDRAQTAARFDPSPEVIVCPR